MKGAFQPASVPITIFVFFLGICITEIHRNSHHGIFGPQIQSDNYRITGELRNVHGGRQWKHQFLGIFDNRFRVNQQSNSEKESNENQYHEGNANQRQRFTSRTYPATNQGRTWCIVIQLDQTHWQHELQVLSAMSVNRILKVTANGTLLNGKRIIRPQDTATQLWLQSCTSVSGKPVKFTQLVKSTSVTAVLVNVHPFISMEALLTDERITTAERILTFNSETRTMEPGSLSYCINIINQ